VYEYRCDERQKVKVEGSTRLVYTGLRGVGKSSECPGTDPKWLFIMVMILVQQNKKRREPGRKSLICLS
jgi:hypothetical protein